MTIPVTDTSYETLVSFPRLASAHGSLTPLERSLLGHFILMVRPRIILELGVYEALTTEFMCDFMALNGIDGRVVGFDLPDVVATLRASNSTIQRLEQESRLELVPGWLPKSLDEWLAHSLLPIDLALVDAMHDYRSVMGELKRLWPRLSPDGFVLCHDYSDKFEGVRYGVDRFSATRRTSVLPLATSERVGAVSQRSVLVVLAPRRYKFSWIRWGHHLYISAKVDLIMHPVFRHIWIHWLRPIVKRGCS